MSGRSRLDALTVNASMCLSLACAAQPPPAAAPVTTQEPPLDDPATCINTEPVSAKPATPPTDTGAAEAGPVDGADARRPDTIRKVIRSQFHLLGACYQLGLGRHATLHGRVTFRFAIDKDGTISELVVSDNELPDCSVVHCFRETMARVTFPPAATVTTVQYPIWFGED